MNNRTENTRDRTTGTAALRGRNVCLNEVAKCC